METENIKKAEKLEYSAEGITEVLRYRKYTPENAKNLPLLIFLHGAGERGDDNEKQLKVGLMRYYLETDMHERFPATVIAPQCPESRRWVETDWDKGSYDLEKVGESDSLKLLALLIKELCEKNEVDGSRVYITGISMGGYGTWNMLMHHPELFAAALPICGGADPSRVDRIKSIPVLTYHADDDWVVPPTSTRETVAALEGIGGKITYIEYHNGLGHGCWDTAYTDGMSIKWLFSNKKQKEIKP